MPTSVLVVAAHPDDEVLGVGGTVARHADGGDQVHTLILAEGLTARGTGLDRAAATVALNDLQAAALKAASVLGALPPRFAGLPDNRMDTMPLLDIVKYVEAMIADVSPTVVYTHHGGDLNVDHRIVHQAVLTACRPLPGCPVQAIYAFETVSSTEWGSPALGKPFIPNRFVILGEQLGRKLLALECYASEMRAFPHPRSIESIEALARVRGSSIGAAAAEAFSVVREISR